MAGVRVQSAAAACKRTETGRNGKKEKEVRIPRLGRPATQPAKRRRKRKSVKVTPGVLPLGRVTASRGSRCVPLPAACMYVILLLEFSFLYLRVGTCKDFSPAKKYPYMLDFPSATDKPAGLLLCEVFSSFGAVSTYVFFRSPWGPRRSLSIVRTGSAPLFFFLCALLGVLSRSPYVHICTIGSLFRHMCVIVPGLQHFDL